MRNQVNLSNLTNKILKKFLCNYVLRENLILQYCARIEMPQEIICKVFELLKENLNWKYILEKARLHNIYSLLYYNLKRIHAKEILPPEIIMELENLYKRSIIESLKYEEELNRILNEFCKNHLKVIILKGFSLGKAYSNSIYLRGGMDIDLLVLQDDIPRIEEILKELGYIFYYQEKINISKIVEWLGYILIRERKRKVLLHPLYVHPQKKIPIEIHTVVFDGALFQKINMKEIWENAQFTSIAGVNTLILSPEDMILTQCPHLSIRHNFELRLLCDIANIVSCYKINWEYIIKKSYEYRVKNSVYFSFYFAQKLLDAPIPSKIMDELKPCWIKKVLLLRLFKDPENFFDNKPLPTLANKMGANGIPLLGCIFMADNIWDVIRIFTIVVLFIINKVLKGGIKIGEE